MYIPYGAQKKTLRLFFKRILMGSKILLSFLLYLARTLIYRPSATNIRSFLSELSELVQRRTAYQSNRTTLLLQEAEKLEADSDLKGALILCQKALEIDPLEPQIYFRLANLYYLQGRQHDVVLNAQEKGLKLMQEKSVALGLDLFGIRIINPETWGLSIGCKCAV